MPKLGVALNSVSCRSPVAVFLAVAMAMRKVVVVVAIRKRKEAEEKQKRGVISSRLAVTDR